MIVYSTVIFLVSDQDLLLRYFSLLYTQYLTGLICVNNVLATLLFLTIIVNFFLDLFYLTTIIVGSIFASILFSQRIDILLLARVVTAFFNDNFLLIKIYAFFWSHLGDKSYNSKTDLILSQRLYFFPIFSQSL